jgi:hypothetical protein
MDDAMNTIRSLLLCTALLAPTAALADEVTCESRKGQRAECDMDTRGEVRLLRQISKTTCIQDTNWGLNRSSIWVDRGCSGVFVSGDDLRGGKGGGYDGGSSYGGAPRGGAAPDQVTCESTGGRRVECDMDTRGRVRVVRQLSKTECIEDTNWGLNRSSIWVDGGCRAVFALEGAGSAAGRGAPSRADLQREDAQYNSSGRAPQAAIRGCNEYAGQGRDGILVSQNALRPGNWEIVLRFGDDRYVCNVTSGGQVSEFQQIN